MNYNDPENMPHVWHIGDVIMDRYEILQIFTDGGMGLVYRAHHKSWNIDLAIKTPRPEYFQNEQQKNKFQSEAETWMQMDLHPNVASCYYVQKIGQIPCIIAEYVEGGTLSEWIRENKLYQGEPDDVIERILDVAIQMAWGGWPCTCKWSGSSRYKTSKHLDDARWNSESQ